MCLSTRTGTRQRLQGGSKLASCEHFNVPVYQWVVSTSTKQVEIAVPFWPPPAL